MEKITLDVAIIGGGTAGMTAMRAASKHTEKVAMIEGVRFGTTCARVGCMPSKLLIAAAESAHHFELARHFGVHVPRKPEINGREVMRRVQSERDRFVGFVLAAIDGYAAEKIIRGTARFEDPHTLMVDDRLEINARTIIIATGAASVIPQQFQNLGDRLLTNENVFELEDLPKSAAVIGTGVIALELGQALHRLGVKVKILGRSGRIATLTDPVVQAHAAEILAQELDITTQTRIHAFQPRKENVEIDFEGQNTQRQTECFEKVLVGTGRRPNLANLGLENSGLELDVKGIPVYDPETAQCGESHVFLAGDVSDYRPLLHEAADEGALAGDNAGRYPRIQRGNRRSPLSIVFSDPQVAMAGRRFIDLDPKSIAIGEVSLENQGRSRVMLVNKGLLRVYAHKQTKEFAGAEMFGPRMEHISHLLAWAHQQKMTIPQMLEMPFYHPVIEEGLRTALREANRQL